MRTEARLGRLAIALLALACFQAPLRAADLTLSPNPITFAGVSSAWSAFGTGSWDGSGGTLQFALSGQFSGNPVLWAVSFDGALAIPTSVTPALGIVSAGTVPGTFAFESTANGSASYSFSTLPSMVSVFFDSGVQSASASATVAADSPPPPPPPASTEALQLSPNPIAFAEADSAWSVLGTGTWNGAMASLSFDLSGVFAGEPVAWQIQFDGQPIEPFFVEAETGAVLASSAAGVFAFQATANGRATYNLSFVPGAIEVSFDNGSESASAMAAVQVVPEPASIWLLLAGLAALLAFSRRRTCNAH